MRSFFPDASMMLWTGVWLTGFAVVHWLVYLPAVMFALAAVTASAPGQSFLTGYSAGRNYT